jgi:hypothetical protein
MPFMGDQNSLGLLQWGISIAVPAASGLSGVLVGALLSQWREKNNRRHDFIAKQLAEFYSPLLSIRKELKATRETEIKISRAADAAWRGLCERYQGDPDRLRSMTEERRDSFTRIIDYNNQSLRTDCIPAYHRMIDVFRNKMWLAKASTEAYFPSLLEFVDIWDRWLSGALPGEVIEELHHSEERLQPLYEELQKTHDELREKLANGA